MGSITTAKPASANDSAADPVYRDLRDQIVSGKLAGQTPLRQDEIAGQFGVSKIPVREALRRLEVEGLVRFERNRGAFVKALSSVDILQLIDVRLALECRALELAIPNMIEADLLGLKKLLNEYASKTKFAQWSQLNLKFHNRLYEPCGNAHLINMIVDLQEKIGPYQRLIVTKATGLKRPIREHAQILDACVARDENHAVNALRIHIDTTKKEVAAHLMRSEQSSH